MCLTMTTDARPSTSEPPKSGESELTDPPVYREAAMPDELDESPKSDKKEGSAG